MCGYVSDSKEQCAVFDDLPRLLTVGQAAKVLQIGRSKGYELTVEYERTGGVSGLPFIWVGNQKRIPRDELAGYVESQLRRPPAA
jgi:excisionase family DNA binding protein